MSKQVIMYEAVDGSLHRTEDKCKLHDLWSDSINELFDQNSCYGVVSFETTKDLEDFISGNLTTIQGYIDFITDEEGQ
jgi:hypothetical protein